MRLLIIWQIILTLLLYSCNPKSIHEEHYSLKDSVLKEHLISLDSLLYFDTTDINYKILKAYKNNDSIFFKTLHNEIEENRNYQRQQKLADNCITLPKLENLGVEEAYRFIYSGAFCPYRINITISNRADSANLHYILYQPQRDTTPCRIISEYDKKLTTEEWKKIINEIFIADFWGLKRENGMHGLDGSSIVATGYIKFPGNYNKPTKFTYVHRWEMSTLQNALHLILQISGNKQGCIWM